MTSATLAAQAGPQQLGGLAGWVLEVIATLGHVGVAVLVALESVFPPIPSEIVLPLAGYLSGTGRLQLAWVVVAATAGSLAGALLLYWAGAALGRDRIRRLADRAPLLGADDVDRAESWFGRHGGSAVLIGRLVPGVRSFVSIPAGVDRMPLPRFAVYTLLGSAIYNAALVGLGYWLGSAWTTVGEYGDIINYAVYAGLAAVVAVFAVRRVRRRRRRAPAVGH